MIRMLSMMLGFCLLSTTVSLAGEPTAEDDLKALLGKGEKYSKWQLQLDKDRKDQTVKGVTLTFYKPSPGKPQMVLVTAEGSDGKVNGGFQYRLEVNDKGRFLIGSKGSVLGDKDVSISYKLEGDTLQLGEAEANLLTVGKFSLKGEWKRIEEK